MNRLKKSAYERLVEINFCLIGLLMFLLYFTGHMGLFSTVNF